MLAGLFPRLEGELLAAKPGVVLLLLSWVLRDAGLWLRSRIPARGWQTWWDGVIVAGSWGLALSWGTLLSGVIGIGGPPALIPAAVLAALFAAHGLAFAALRLRGTLRHRAAVLSGHSGGTGEVRTFALTAVALAVVGVLTGLRLPLEAGSSGSWLAPVILALLPALVAAQAWVWWTFRHRVTGPSYL